MATHIIELIVKGVDQGASKVLGGVGGHLSTLGKVAIGAGGVAAAGLGAIGAGLGKLALDAAPIVGVEESFRSMVESMGQGSDEMLESLQKGSLGMSTQAELMKKWNLGAQLISKDFAATLPDAMEHFAKISAATGEDVNYLIESYIRGVGRLSPPILDNLAIQVSQAEATARAAEMYGVAESELTKLQMQMGMSSVVMEKLAANTASMPDITDLASTKIAQLKTKFGDLKDTAGKSLIPALSGVLNILMQGADFVIPIFAAGIQTIGDVIGAFVSGAPGDFPWEDIFPPWLADVAYQVSDLFERLVAGITGAVAAAQMVGATWRTVIDSFLYGMGATQEFRIQFSMLATDVVDMVSKVVDAVTAFVSWKDILIALGVAVASVVIPALVSIVTAAAPVIAVGVALVGAIALVRTAWESNWLGIQDITRTAGEFIGNVIIPLITGGLEFLRTNVLPILQSAWESVWTAATTFWDGFWSGFEPALSTMYGSLEKFWSEIKPALAEAWEALNELWSVVVDIWQTSLNPALDRLSTALGLGGDKTGEFGEKVGALVGLLLSVGLEAILNGIIAAIEGFTAAVNAVAAAMDAWHSIINSIRTALDNLSVPTSLLPGSPSPLELSILGITEAMKKMEEANVRLFATSPPGAEWSPRYPPGSLGAGSPMMVLAPIFMDSRDIVNGAGEINYAAVGGRLRELQGNL